ncbi:hypothetical protein [Brachybacterium sp. NPDC056505]|jgi:hypothetical protein|uniref:hypothetical protein n=1 Tax=Brachybacterium sp. NPDC056505 TaxID=3345843 RepID=UPI00367040B5
MTVVWLLTLIAAGIAALFVPPKALEKFQRGVWAKLRGITEKKTEPAEQADTTEGEE